MLLYTPLLKLKVTIGFVITKHLFVHFDTSDRPWALLSKLPPTGNVYKSNYQAKQMQLKLQTKGTLKKW